MSKQELNTELYKKMFAEQEKFREWLLEYVGVVRHLGAVALDTCGGAN